MAYFLPEYAVHHKAGEFEVSYISLKMYRSWGIFFSFQLQDIIAKGAFGNVLRVVRAKDGLVYAMKVWFCSNN
jgi:hypothetical protein